MKAWNKKRRIIRRYDATADIYDRRYSEEQSEKYRLALQSLKSEKLGSVLDAGCGTGLFFEYIADKSEAIVGLDISRKALGKVRERGVSLHAVSLILADVEAIPLKGGSFDHVFAMTVLQNSPSPVEALKEMRRISKKGAIIVVTGLKRIFPLSEFTRLLGAAGLTVSDLKDDQASACRVALCINDHH